MDCVMSLTSVLKSSRPAFLLLTPICVWLGAVLAMPFEKAFGFHLGLVFLGALFAHVSVNLLNEYVDYASGLDLTTTRTPFSGGSGALPDDPSAARGVLVFGVGSLLLTISIGVYLLSIVGLKLLPLGLVGVLLVIAYTPFINRSPLLCLIAPGLGFGSAMVMGTQLVISGEYSATAFWVSLVPFFLMNNLLLLNQFPDVDADRKVGRRTFPIAYGIQVSCWVYVVFTFLAYAIIVILLMLGLLPIAAIIALLPAMLSAYALFGAWQYGKNIGGQTRFLAANVASSLSVPLLLAFSLM